MSSPQSRTTLRGFFQEKTKYESQDIEYEFLDIGNEMMSASIFWGFARYTGTPKTTDTTLALLWNRSSQAEWVIRCEHCNKFNIPNPEQDLLKMIGKRGPVCAKCGQPVFPKNGGYVHARPERQLSFPGYHISQTVHPLHILSQAKWNRLLDKIENYAPLALYNEVFGWPYDAATSPLTMSDLQKATHDISVQRPADVRGLKHLYSYITVAVDWSGGSMVSDSYTAYAVLGLRRDSDLIDVLYGKRIKHGVTPTDEANEIMDWIRGTGADAFTYDNGGAGFARLEIMNHQGLRETPGLVVIPINYVRPRAGDVMVPHTGMRESDLYYYTLDKSRSLAITVMSIKATRVRVPKFAETDEKAFQAICWPFGRIPTQIIFQVRSMTRNRIVFSRTGSTDASKICPLPSTIDGTDGDLSDKFGAPSDIRSRSFH